MEKKGNSAAELFRTAMKVVTSPAAFFREMPRTGGFVEPLVFLIAAGAVTGVVTAVLGLIGLENIFSTGMAIAAILLIPAAYAVLGFLLAALAHVVWKLLGSQEPYETAYRCVAYIGAFMPIVAVLNVIPYAGWVLVVALVTFLYVTASIEVHKIGSQKAWLVFGIIGVAVLFLGLGGEIGMRSAQRESDQRIEEMRRNTEEMQKKLEEMKKELENK